MDALDILEAMAANASLDAGTIDTASVEKWQRLFDYSAKEASKKIEEQRDDLTATVSESLWDAVSGQQAPLGHDRESYSHWLRLHREVSATPSSISPSESGKCSIGNIGQTRSGQGQEFLLRLEGPISSAARVAEIARLASLPKTFEGASETDAHAVEPVQFCRVDGAAKQAIIAWINQHHPSFRPMFVMRSLARKNFDTATISPTLGCDASLPQHRLNACDTIPRPTQGEYPVWYFFYGTLASQETLHILLQHLDGEQFDVANYNLRRARVAGGRLTTWGNKYKALVDDKAGDEVEGSAFLVQSELHEEALRSYETSAYEVVRCQIRFCNGNDETLPGCTFRLANR